MKPLDVGNYGNRSATQRGLVRMAVAESSAGPGRTGAPVRGLIARSRNEQRYLTAATWLIVATLAALLAASQTSAQDYERIEINPKFVLPKESDFAPEDRREYRNQYRKIKSQISDARDNVEDALKAGSTNFSTDGELYLREYRIAQMTQSEDLYLSNLGRLRSEFLREFLDRRAAPQTRRPMIEKIVPLLEEIVQKNYHPAVRLNAVTLIGLLDEREGDSSVPPTPSPAAYESLKRIWNNTELTEAIRVGAMSGIRRFAELSRAVPRCCPG